jgi:hypothetical protein
MNGQKYFRDTISEILTTEKEVIGRNLNPPNWEFNVIMY